MNSLSVGLPGVLKKTLTFRAYTCRTGTWLVGTFECILHLWLARDSYALSTSLRWEQDHYALPLELLKFVAQLFTGWCLSGCVAAAAALVSISKVSTLLLLLLPFCCVFKLCLQNQNSVSAVSSSFDASNFSTELMCCLSRPGPPLRALRTHRPVYPCSLHRRSASDRPCAQLERLSSESHVHASAANGLRVAHGPLGCGRLCRGFRRGLDLAGDAAVLGTRIQGLLCGCRPSSLPLYHSQKSAGLLTVDFQVRRCCHESARKVVLEAAEESTAGDPYSEQEPGVMLLDSDMDNSQDSQTTIQPPSDASKKV